MKRQLAIVTLFTVLAFGIISDTSHAFLMEINQSQTTLAEEALADQLVASPTSDRATRLFLITGKRRDRHCG